MDAKSYLIIHKRTITGNKTWGAYNGKLIRNLNLERRDICNQMVLIYGFGAIGQTLGRLCKSLGMNVIGVKRTVIKIDTTFCDKIIHPNDIDLYIPMADFVAITSPLTNETNGFFDKDRLYKMKPSSFFINVGRGAVCDEIVLCQMLKTKRIAGAYLDAFIQEPLPPSHAFWTLDNVILSPHDSASCKDNDDRVLKIFESNMTKLARSITLDNIVYNNSSSSL